MAEVVNCIQGSVSFCSVRDALGCEGGWDGEGGDSFVFDEGDEEIFGVREDGRNTDRWESKMVIHLD